MDTLDRKDIITTVMIDQGRLCLMHDSSGYAHFSRLIYKIVIC